jgi:vacuolar protein sorting-associated protein 35
VLELCHVLIRDQTDISATRTAAAGGAGLNGQSSGAVNTANASIRKQGPHFVEREEMAEEQGWVARVVHLFRAESLDVQFEVRFFLRIPM